MTIQLFVAEDHDIVREGLRATFKDTGIEILGEATNAVDAARLAVAARPDVMLLDLSMPGGDGFEVLERVKADRPELAVLIYTLHDRPDYETRARELQATGYLTKSASAEALVDAVCKASQGTGTWSDSVACEGSGERDADVDHRSIVSKEKRCRA